MIGATTENGKLIITGEIAIPNAEGGQWPPERITKLLDTIEQTVHAAEFADRETRGLPPMVSSVTVPAEAPERPVMVHIPTHLIQMATWYPDIDWNDVMRHARRNAQQGGKRDHQKGDEEVARTPQAKGQQPQKTPS